MDAMELTTAKTTSDLEQILALQRRNLPSSLSADELREQGFVTVVHTLQNLLRMNMIHQHVIGKNGTRIIAYLLAMTEHSKEDIPVLEPMFAMFRQLSFAGRPLTDYHYIVVGQVCVDKDFRGQGILDRCYDFYRQTYSPVFDFAITEIDATNTRSLAAHKRIGFRELHRFYSADGIEWVIVIWDWKGLAFFQG